ncbi:MAG: chemotaxis protein CheD [Lachnospiraceae bacterium]|nr:chemotaxis protein CheD [Lachnospiraceae bacterium]
MGKMIKIGMADLAVCLPPDSITTLGLGSCIGCVLYDPVSKVSGMVHVMLPDSTKIRNNENIAKFADTGVQALFDQVIAAGASKSRLIAKIAGGAQMFAFKTDNEMLKVGERNAEGVIKKLNELKIPIKAQDTGGHLGRTIEFYPENGDLLIKSVGVQPYTI